jgi:hypothetical protein
LWINNFILVGIETKREGIYAAKKIPGNTDE